MSKKEKKSGKDISRYLRVAVRIVLMIGIVYCFYLFITHNPPPETREFNEHRFVLIPSKGILGGVLAGIAYYFAFPLWVVRIIFVLPFVLSISDNDLISDIASVLIITYILMWMFVPAINFTPADFMQITGG